MKNGCVYGSEPCPKVEKVDKRVDNILSTLNTLKRICYILVGITLTQYGILIV